ncbi:MAG: SPFH domain-containing protein [Candidatus Pacebacteria bacterium]|nr:SPFH domain-containing protein [Candidatus Paceibacterota bacterium]
MKELVAKLIVRAIEALDSFGIKVTTEQAKRWVSETYRRLLFWVPIILVYGLLLMTAVGLAFFSDVEIFGEKYSRGTIMIYALLLYTAASLRIIGPTELGCRLFFGKPIDNVSSGLTFVPLWVCELETETRLVIQDELPTEPDKIYRGGDGDEFGRTVPKELQALGWKPPIRITFSGHNAESEVPELMIGKEDPYDTRLTAEVVPVIRWKIDDFVDFLKTIGSVESARKQMEDTCVKTFTELLTKISPAVALLRIKKYSEDLQKEIETLVDTWGIRIDSAQIKAINFSQTLNAAVQGVVVQERKKAASILEGQGLGGKEEAILKGRTEGLKKMMTDLEIKGEVVIGAETARAIAGEGEKSSQRTIIAGSGGFADLIGAATAIGESLRTKQGDA